MEVPHKVVEGAKSKICVKNVNKKLKRRDKKIKECKSEISIMSKENQVLHSCLAATQRASEKNLFSLS